jgi:hypothetical protein
VNWVWTGREPLITNIGRDFRGTLDYILFPRQNRHAKKL